MPDLIKESRPTARKLHRCSMCTGPIRPGEQYNRDTLVYDDQIYDWLTCPDCAADSVVNRVWNWSGSYIDEGVGPETAHEWATEAVIYGTTDDQRAAKNYLERWGADA